jgi:hypothetical protein
MRPHCLAIRHTEKCRFGLLADLSGEQFGFFANVLYRGNGLHIKLLYVKQTHLLLGVFCRLALGSGEGLGEEGVELVFANRRSQSFGEFVQFGLHLPTNKM